MFIFSYIFRRWKVIHRYCRESVSRCTANGCRLIADQKSFDSEATNFKVITSSNSSYNCGSTDRQPNQFKMSPFRQQKLGNKIANSARTISIIRFQSCKTLHCDRLKLATTSDFGVCKPVWNFSSGYEPRSLDADLL